MNSQRYNGNARLGEHYNRYSNREVTPWNQNDIGHFSEEMRDDIKWSIKQEPGSGYREWVDYINANSGDRDTGKYPNPNEYVVTLPHEIRNISSVELVHGIIPDKNNVTREPFLLLHVQEFEDVMISSNKAVSDAFAMLLMNSPVVTGYFINVYHKVHEKLVKYFKTPKASLTKLTIKITDRNGDLFDFGGTSSDYDNNFTFKVTRIEKDTGKLQNRVIL